MSEKRLSNIERDVSLIRAALLGPEGNPKEGVLARLGTVESDVEEAKGFIKGTKWVLGVLVAAVTLGFIKMGGGDVINAATHQITKN